MIVYGDPQYDTNLHEMAAHLRTRAASRDFDTTPSSKLARLRALLVLTGQLEQSLFDAPAGLLAPAAGRSPLDLSHAATEHTAEAFFSCWANLNGLTQLACEDVPASLAELGGALDGLAASVDVPLTVKVPEGYAFYALYPEQYCASALRWLEEHAQATSGQALVVGIRSIGTSLAAVMSAALRAAGWETHSFTVRPTGHPFERRAAIAPEQTGGAGWALVVDEGPGLSGSSMAAAAQALVEAGIPRDRICFFPAHANEPGSAASEQVRAWWASTPRYTTSLDRTPLDGRPLLDLLASEVSRLLDGDAVASLQDLGGGQWRRLAYASPAEWPAVCAPFERPKYLLTMESGKRVLARFEGLAGVPGGLTSEEAAAESMRMRAWSGWTLPPLDTLHGFVLVPWIDGVRLVAGDKSELGVLEQAGRYVAQVAGPPLSPSEAEAALSRAEEMLYWNTWEALGEDLAERARRWVRSRVHLGTFMGLPRYGDGHLAPHEWLRTPEGRVLKMDAVSHERDHTAVGPQPAAWDLAGAIVEWDCNHEQTARLLAAYRSAGGQAPDEDLLDFGLLAYTAFRVGQCHLCAGMSAHDPDEQARLWAAYEGYKVELGRFLESAVEG